MLSRATVAYARATRRGAVRREVQEKYVRDDPGVGRVRGEVFSAGDLRDAAARASAAGEVAWVVVDTNVVLHQMDALEHAAVACAALDRLVVAQTVVAEVRHRDKALYRRLRALAADASKTVVLVANEHAAATAVERRDGESPNDANDRAIRRVASVVTDAVGDAGAVAFVTDDADCRRLAAAEGLRAETTRALCQRVGGAAVADLVAAPADATDRPAVFAAHLDETATKRGLAAGDLLEGVFRADPRSSRHGVVRCARGDADVRVRLDGAAAVNRAVDGDRVAVALGDVGDVVVEDDDDAGDAPAVLGAACAEEAEDRGERRGRVVAVTRRTPRTLCGSFELRSGDDPAPGAARLATFCPVDRRYPKVLVETRQLARLRDQRVVVAVDGWAVEDRFPRGHYVEALGARGDKATETAVLLRELEIAAGPFSVECLACLPLEGDRFVISEAEVATRLDLRHLDVCSIDPPGCRDIDDALHCARRGDLLEVGVHIADVTHFVASGSPLDEEAARRGTSTYLVDRRLDMLPGLLTADLCSLRAGVDRLAFSAIVTVDPGTGAVVGRTFAKTIIRSRAALTYHQAQAMIDDADGARDASAVAASVRALAGVARTLRAARFARGALALASPEVRFEMDRSADAPTDVGAYQLVEANATVEEFMLLANVEVAAHLAAAYPALALLRHHPAPPAERFATLVARAAKRNLRIDATSSKALADSLDAAVDADDPYLNKLLRIAATRCMAPAKYFCARDRGADDRGHYGLAADVYTHFTSPIRRYADVVAHRLLAAAIGRAPLPPAFAAPGASAALGDLAEGLNRRTLNAQRAGRRSVALHTRLFFKAHPRPDCAARVLAVNDTGLELLLPDYGVELPLRLVPRGSDASLDVDDGRHEVRWTARGVDVAVRVFDAVRVAVSVTPPKSAEDDVGAVLIELLDPAPPPAEEAPAAKRRRTAG